MASGYHPYSVRENHLRPLLSFAFHCLRALSSQHWGENASYLLGGRQELMLEFFLHQKMFEIKNFLFVTPSRCHPLSRRVAWVLAHLPARGTGWHPVPARRGAAQPLIPAMSPGCTLRRQLHSCPQHHFASCKGGWRRLDVAPSGRDVFCLFWFSIF